MAETRSLGLWETIQKTFFDTYRCAGMMLQIIRVEGGLESRTLAQGLSLLQQRHPMLRARFREADGRTEFIIPDSSEPWAPVPLRVLPLADDRQARRIGEAEALLEFDNGCLWRVIMLEGGSCCDIVFLIHHAIADGYSIVRLVHELLGLCSSIARQEKIECAALPLLPAVEDLLNRDLPPDTPDLQPPATESLELEPFCFEGYAPLPERRLGTCSRLIELADVLLLQTRCRAHGVTPTGAITAALLLAEQSAGGGFRCRPLESAISLRRFCQPPIGSEHIGCNIMMLRTQYALQPGAGFWDFAAYCQQELQRCIANKQRQGFLPRSFHQAFVNTVLKKNMAKADADRCYASGICFSNGGVFAIEPQYAPFRVTELYNFTCEAAGLWKYFLGTHVLHGRLYFDYSFAEPLVSRTTVEHIADTVVETITRQARN